MYTQFIFFTKMLTALTCNVSIKLHNVTFSNSANNRLNSITVSMRNRHFLFKKTINNYLYRSFSNPLFYKKKSMNNQKFNRFKVMNYHNYNRIAKSVLIFRKTFNAFFFLFQKKSKKLSVFFKNFKSIQTSINLKLQNSLLTFLLMLNLIFYIKDCIIFIRAGLFFINHATIPVRNIFYQVKQGDLISYPKFIYFFKKFFKFYYFFFKKIRKLKSINYKNKNKINKSSYFAKNLYKFF